MAVHQRYFPVYEKDGTNLLPYFITVRNGNVHGLETVRQGNERVIRARLSDARFFYQEDQKVALVDFEKKAANAIFFPERGSQQDRTERIQLLTEKFSKDLLPDQKDQEEAKELQNSVSSICKRKWFMNSLNCRASWERGTHQFGESLRRFVEG